MKISALVSVMIIIVACENNPYTASFEGAQKELPSFNLLLIDSTQFSTQFIPNDKPIVMFQFRSQCIYSQLQMKEITENIKMVEDIRFYAFTTEPFNEMKAFTQKYSLNKFSNIKIGIDYMNFFEQFYTIQSIPFVAVYDKNKRINKVFVGKVSVKQIRNALEN